MRKGGSRFRPSFATLAAVYPPVKARGGYNRMQAAWCPGLISRSSGIVVRHSATPMGHRGWNTQPEGGLSGLGTSHHVLPPGLDHRVRDGYRREQGLRVRVLGVLVK